jgi:hypothetical protein
MDDSVHRSHALFFSSIANGGAVASEWVIDGETVLDNELASEFVYGGAYGFEQFFGIGFEVSGDAAAALQQSLQPKNTNFPEKEESYGDEETPYENTEGSYGDEEESTGSEYNGGIIADSAIVGDIDEGAGTESVTTADALGGGGGTRRRLNQERDATKKPEQQKQNTQKRRPTGKPRLLSDKEANERKLPKGSYLVTQVRQPLPKVGVRANSCCNTPQSNTHIHQHTTQQLNRTRL